MEDRKPTDIFSEAARARKPVSKEISKKKARIPPTDITPPVQKIEKDNKNVSLDELIANVNKYRDEVVAKLDVVQKELGMSSKDIKDYLSNPSNFKPQQWEYLKQQKKLMQERLVEQLGVEVANLAEKKKVETTSKERKGRTLGSRKNWIPIR